MRSLRAKFIKTLLLVAALIALPALAIVLYSSIKTSSDHLRATQQHIEAGIASKGRVLTENHALALRNLSLDNAFIDMQSLVEGAVAGDSDLIFGLYVDADGRALAFSRTGVSSPPNTLPDADAWKSVGLQEAELNVPDKRVHRRQVFGHDVLEVAVPIPGEQPGDRILGTIHYAFSTRQMTDAMRRAEIESRARLERTLLLLGAVIGVATLIGLLLSRMQASRITRPLTELTQAADRLAMGDRTVRVVIDSNDELSQLGSSFNHMVDDLNASYVALEEANRTLEAKVQRRTEELARKNRDMRLVFENVQQGFLTLDEDGVIVGESSRMVFEWFGATAEGETLWSYLSRTSEQFSFELEFAWEQLQDGKLPPEVCLAQLPSVCRSPSQTFNVQYLPLLTDRTATGYLVVLDDITEKLLRQHDDEVQTELMEVFKRLTKDRAGFLAFHHRADELIAEILDPQADEPVRLRRSIHTLKGNCDMMGLSAVARLCHQLEDQMAQDGALSNGSRMMLRGHWDSLNEHLGQLLGTLDKGSLAIPLPSYHDVLGRLVAARVDESLVREVRSWNKTVVGDDLERLAAHARNIALRLGKPEPEVAIEGADVPVDPEVWAPLVAELGHVVRNCVDHGIEPAEERLVLGKPAQGRVAFIAQTTASACSLEISDDGRGIDWALVRTSALARHIPAETEEQLTAALFVDGLSTKVAPDAISGRGVGMAAVRRAVDSLGGSISVRSVVGEGTKWRITVPLPLNTRPQPPQQSD